MKNIAGPDFQANWRRVRGPAGALVATLHERGWQMEGPTNWIDAEGGSWKLLGQIFEPVVRYFQQANNEGVWRAAAQGRLGRGLEKGAFLKPTKEFLREHSQANNLQAV